MACRFSAFLWLAVLAANSCASANSSTTAPAEPMPAAATHPLERVHFVVLHTNDVHGQVLPRKATWLKRPDPPMVGGLARVAARVKREKAAAEKDGALVLVVDGGDWYQGTPEGVVDDGLPFLVAMSGVGYDAVCVGNHEFDFGVPNLVKLIRDSKLPAVVANLTERETGKPIAWAPPWRIVQKGAWKIAIVGLLTPETPEITHPDAQKLVFGDPARALTQVRTALPAGIDWILPITHLGVDDDRAVAKAHPELPLIVGGHSHTFLKEGVREGQTLIVQTGAKASALGRVDVWFDAQTKKVLESSARLIDLDAEPAPEDRVAAVDTACAALVKRSEARMNEVVGELAAPLERAKDPLSSSSAGNFLADALRQHAVADVGLMNRGGIRADLDAGPITRRHAFELCPFENNVTVLTITGSELAAMITKSVEGTAHSGLEVSGIVVEVAVDAKGSRTLSGLKVGGAPVDPKKEYRVALNSFLADGGDAYVEKVLPGPKRKDDMVLMRDLIEETFRNQKKVVPNAENRYVVTRTP
ncbi:MAG: bifunctional UDP-sugar hydrolase/5'-nucleotidase [Planctomycetota bacterium]|nr:bifunctional UDP-sugar hydrolase/5'-nucleotidase [Planctomycetota bacterium]